MVQKGYKKLISWFLLFLPLYQYFLLEYAKKTKNISSTFFPKPCFYILTFLRPSELCSSYCQLADLPECRILQLNGTACQHGTLASSCVALSNDKSKTLFVNEEHYSFDTGGKITQFTFHFLQNIFFFSTLC